MSQAVVALGISRGIARIVLNRPAKQNALNQTMMAQLQQHLQQAKDDDNIHCVVLSGSGNHFCSGHDFESSHLNHVTSEKTVIDDLTLHYHPIIELMSGFNKPIICAVNGLVADAGLALCCASDLVIADDETHFKVCQQPYFQTLNMGLSWHLPRIIGLQNAKAWTLTNRLIDTNTALSWGLIYQSVPLDELTKTAEKLAQSITEQSAPAYFYKKHLLQHSHFSGSLHEQLTAEASTQTALNRRLK